MFKRKTIPLFTLFLLLFFSEMLFSKTNITYSDPNIYYQARPISLKTFNGKFYAYIVLLFNENPHFVNLIENGSIPYRVMAHDGFHIKEYRNYLHTLKKSNIYSLGRTLLAIYLQPRKYNNSFLRAIEKKLAHHFIILRFSKDKSDGIDRMTLDYCIFGKKILCNVWHPFFKINEKIYNIQPFIYYDEFSTSNSTFYFDMIYINPVEVQNDSLIAKKILNNTSVDSMFFVGSQVTDDIKFCLKKSFTNKKPIRDVIWEMFVIHELTHKVLNNKYNNFDQITGETLSLHSTIYANVYLGLSVMYSYLNYNKINPHRIAAMKYINFIANKTKNKDIIENPGLIKKLPVNDIKRLTKEHFELILKNY